MDRQTAKNLQTSLENLFTNATKQAAPYNYLLSWLHCVTRYLTKTILLGVTRLWLLPHQAVDRSVYNLPSFILFMWQFCNPFFLYGQKCEMMTISKASFEIPHIHWKACILSRGENLRALRFRSLRVFLTWSPGLILPPGVSTTNAILQ